MLMPPVIFPFRPSFLRPPFGAIETEVSCIWCLDNLQTVGYTPDMHLDNCIPRIHDISAAGKDCKMYRRQKILINGMYRWMSFSSTQELVDKVIDIALAESRMGNGPLFSEYMAHWYDTYKKPGLDENTAKNYRNYMTNHINPVIGSKRISEITVEDVQTIMSGFTAASSAKQARSIINLVMEAAIADEIYLHPNPTRDKRICMPTGRTKRRALTSDEMAQLMMCLPSLTFECAQLLAMLIMTGSRRGEALGACWEDIDWSAGTIHLQRVVRFRNNAAEVSSKMKTENANRTVLLWDDLTGYLGVPQENGFIINSHSEPLTERMYRIRWGRLMRELKSLGVMFTFTAHQLRHTYATIAANSGTIPMKVLQGMLGHANFQTTMNIYADLDADKMRESSRELGAEYAKIREKVAESCRL